MNLYIDKENLLSLIGAQSHEMYQDCVKLIRKQLDTFFSFSKDELLTNEILAAWFSYNASQGVGDNNQMSYSSNFPQRPLKSNSPNNFNNDQLFATYLLDDIHTDKIKNSGGVLVGCVGEEIDIIHKLFLLQNDYLLEKELRIGDPGFEKWEDLKQYSTPLTDIVLIDPFILKKYEDNDYTIDCNLVKLLEIYCSQSKYKVNIVIIYKSSECHYNLDDVKERINNQLTPILGKSPSVTFIATTKEHDRNIITNYTRLSGNTFNYWDDNGRKITKGKDVTIKSLAKKENHRNATLAIQDIQNIIDSIATIGDLSNIFGDKQSRLLRFTV